MAHDKHVAAIEKLQTEMQQKKDAIYKKADEEDWNVDDLLRRVFDLAEDYQNKIDDVRDGYLTNREH